jgi:hypothetical protein
MNSLISKYVGILRFFCPWVIGLVSSDSHADLFDADFSAFNLNGLLDLRYHYSDSQSGGIENGLGKFRDGGNNSRVLANEAALVLQTRLDWDWSSTLTLKYADHQHTPVDLSEAFLVYRPVSTSAWQFGTRLGMFIPPVSMENTGTAWTSPYSLTSSAINTWVGEELKVFGAEAHIRFQTEGGDRLKWFAAGFANNDTAGVLLAWRGWSLHDYEATLNDQFVLPESLGIQTHLPLQLQASATKPFVEVDGRPGYYSGVSIDRPEAYNFRVLYYDNLGNPSALENGQYSWRTQFWSLGLQVHLPWEWTFISQGMSGQTRMGERIQGLFAVDTRFWSASFLISKKMGNQRFSIRHDYFATDENDFLPLDRNEEKGHALTINYNLTLAQRHQINFEFTHIDSDRQSRVNLEQQTRQEENLWQIAYRLFF